MVLQTPIAVYFEVKIERCGGVKIFDFANDTHAKFSQEQARLSRSDWMKAPAAARSLLILKWNNMEKDLTAVGGPLSSSAVESKSLILRTTPMQNFPKRQAVVFGEGDWMKAPVVCNLRLRNRT